MKGRLERQLQVQQSLEKRLDDYPALLKEFYYSEQKHSYKTKQMYFLYIRRFLDCVGKDVTEITPSDINRFLVSISMKNGGTEETSGTYRATVWSALNSFFEFCERSDVIEHNPMNKVDRPTPKRSEDVERCVVTPEEFQRILQNVKEGVNQYTRSRNYAPFRVRDELIFKMLIYTGLRVAALMEINVDDIDFKEATVNTVNKRGKVFVIPLNSEIMPCLNKYMEARKRILKGREEDALFLSKNGKRMSVSTVEHTIKIYTYNVDKNISPHKFRGTYATMLYEATHDISFVQDCMGHSSAATTKIYVKSNAEKQRRIAGDILKKQLNVQK